MPARRTRRSSQVRHRRSPILTRPGGCQPPGPDPVFGSTFLNVRMRDFLYGHPVHLLHGSGRQSAGTPWPIKPERPGIRPVPLFLSRSWAYHASPRRRDHPPDGMMSAGSTRNIQSYRARSRCFSPTGFSFCRCPPRCQPRMGLGPLEAGALPTQSGGRATVSPGHLRQVRACLPFHTDGAMPLPGLARWDRWHR
jgi:hypothetical protein